jgi:hypothetical protein
MAINLEMVGKKLEPVTYEYTMRDVMLYALGVGCQPDELEFIYENGLKVLPTFGVIPPFPSLGRLIGVMDINIAMVVHGEQRLELYKPYSRSRKTYNCSTDKGCLRQNKRCFNRFEDRNL